MSLQEKPSTAVCHVGRGGRGDVISLDETPSGMALAAFVPAAFYELEVHNLKNNYVR
jgi:hypothetical protein